MRAPHGFQRLLEKIVLSPREERTGFRGPQSVPFCRMEWPDRGFHGAPLSQVMLRTVHC